MGRPYFASLVPSIGMQHLAGQGMLSQGKAIFVRPYTGSDANSGLRPDRAVKSLTQALTLATANQNDVVYLMAESNTAANTTDYQTTLLNWNKDGVHLVGVNGGSAIGQRSRIAWASTASTSIDTELFRLSANNCLIANVEMYQGLASATSMLGCMSITGMRNKIFNCQISGMGHADNVIAGAYSLHMNGSSENLIERCYIGLDTISRATDTTSEIRFSASAARCIFKDCTIVSQVGHATYSPYVYFNGAMAIDRWVKFENCDFINFSPNYAITQAVAMLHSATPTTGITWVRNCGAMATNWSAAGVKTYLVNSAINTAYTGGTGYAS